MYHAKDGWIIIVKAIDSILYYLLNNKVISLYRFGELIAFLERDKFFGFLHKLITDLARNRVNNVSTETVKSHLMLYETAGRLGFLWDTVIQPFDLQIFIYLAIFELFEAGTKCTAIYGMSSVWLTEILETFPQAFWFEKSRIKENGGKVLDWQDRF